MYEYRLRYAQSEDGNGDRLTFRTGTITLQMQSPVKIGFVNDGFERYVDAGEHGNDGVGIDNFSADPLAIYLISRG